MRWKPLVLAMAVLASNALAQPVSPSLEGLDMIDARVNLPEAWRQAASARPGALASGLAGARGRTEAIRAALAGLRQSVPGLEARISEGTGAPELLHAGAGTLTPPAPGRSSEAIVREFLAKNRGVYGLSAEDLRDLAVLGDSPGGSSGLRMLRMEQRVDGRPVFQSETRFVLRRDGALLRSLGRMVPHARQAAEAGRPEWRLTREEALARLLEASAPAAGPITARQVFFPLAPGLLVPAWSLVVSTSGEQDWYALVDARTGALLWRKNIRESLSAHDARFRVYVQADGTTPADSPAPASPNSFAIGAGTQGVELSPTIVGMHAAMDALASPNGWIDDCPGGVCGANQTQTLGNNVLACLDRTGGANDNVCDTDAAGVLDGNGRPTGNPDAGGRNRDFLGTAPRDFQTDYLPPPQSGNPEAGQTASGAGSNGTLRVDRFRRGAITNAFYAANWYHDRLYGLGFDEASGNFQATNFSGQGAGGDRVLLDSQDASSFNGANSSTPPDGASLRVQAWLFPGPTIDRDATLDTEILFHELTHGTSHRLVGNAAGLNWDPGRGMGEGWSDFVALSLLNDSNADSPDGRYPAFSYGYYKILAGYLDNYVYGGRRFPYSTDNAVNPLTWADVDDITNNLGGGMAPSPINTNSRGGMEVHNAGEVWALSLWEARSRVIADPSGANGDVPAGNHAMLQIVIDAMKLTPVDPSFIDGRDALFAADCAANACANEEALWGGFADRGLGYEAGAPLGMTSPSKVLNTSTQMSVQESFRLPYLDVIDPAADLIVDDASGNGNGVVDPGEAVRLTVRLSNPWRSAGKAVAGVSATLSSTTPGVTIHDATAAYGAIAPGGTATGEPFLLTLDSATCASAIDFTLQTVSNLGTTTAGFRLRVGQRNGTDPVVTLSRVIPGGMPIPNNDLLGATDTFAVPSDLEIADLDVRIDSLTHTFTGQVSVSVQGPTGYGATLAYYRGLISGGGLNGDGDNFVNVVFDDDLAPSVATDLNQTTPAQAPFTGSWLPAFNSPIFLAVSQPNFEPDPNGQLARFDGTSTAGSWRMHANDLNLADSGTLDAWSLLVTPRHFDCAPFSPAVAIGGTKSVSAGPYPEGASITYTVTLTNDGTAKQADNPGPEFTDTLPAGLTLTGASATSGTAVATLATNTVTWNGALIPLGGSVALTIHATIDAGTAGTNLSNQGSIAYDADHNGSNEAAALTDDPAVGGSSDPTTFTVLASTPTRTPTPPPTATRTATPPASATATRTPTPPPSPTPSSTPTRTTTPSGTPTQTAALTPTATRTPTPPPTATRTATPPASATATRTPTPPPSPTPSSTPTRTTTPSGTPTQTAALTPTTTSTATQTALILPSATSTATPTPLIVSTTTSTATHTPPIVPSTTSTATHTPLIVSTTTSTATHTPSIIPTTTSTPTPTPPIVPSTTSTPTPTPLITPLPALQLRGPPLLALLLLLGGWRLARRAPARLPRRPARGRNQFLGNSEDLC